MVLKCAVCFHFHFADLTERSFPREFHELGSIYYHNVDKDGHKICEYETDKYQRVNQVE